MTSNSKVYHFECFSCQVCLRRFQPGDEYQVIDDQVYCKEDAQTVLLNSSTANHHYNVPPPYQASYHLQQPSQPSQPPQPPQPPPLLSQQHLYLNQMTFTAASSSTISLTPENSVHSGASSSSSFSPNTNSSSSSIVDSPSSSSAASNSYTQPNASFTSYASNATQLPYMTSGSSIQSGQMLNLLSNSQMQPVYSTLQNGFGVDGNNNNNNNIIKDAGKIDLATTRQIFFK